MGRFQAPDKRKHRLTMLVYVLALFLCILFAEAAHTAEVDGWFGALLMLGLILFYKLISTEIDYQIQLYLSAY